MDDAAQNYAVNTTSFNVTRAFTNEVLTVEFTDNSLVFTGAAGPEWTAFNATNAAADVTAVSGTTVTVKMAAGAAEGDFIALNFTDLIATIGAGTTAVELVTDGVTTKALVI